MFRSRLIILSMLLVLLFSATGVYAQVPAPQGTPLGSGFMYQGQLKKGGQPFNGSCDFQFGLYNAATAGNQAGPLLTRLAIKVVNGAFATKLDFGANVFTGEARWLQIAVKCPGDSSFIAFAARQELAPTPYAISLMPGALVHNSNGSALNGHSNNSYGLTGASDTGYAGIYGTSSNGYGVFGSVNGAIPRAGIYGKNDGAGFGVFGQNTISGYGVFGLSKSGNGVAGDSTSGAGVAGNSVSGIGVYGKSATSYAGFFDGKVRVSSLEIAGGADLTEPFDVSSTSNAAVVPGTVVCIDPANPGKLFVCTSAYDHTVAGVISGAGGIQPGMVMSQNGTAANGQHPIALTGRVYVWVDATQNPIHPGDLLTTSTTPGHAAKATDHDAAQGAIIGKAMGMLKSGKGLVLVLVNLQ